MTSNVSKLASNFHITVLRQAEVQGAIENAVKGVPVELVGLIVHYTSLMEVQAAEDEDIQMLIARLNGLNTWLIPEALEQINNSYSLMLTKMFKPRVIGIDVLSGVSAEFKRELSLLVFYKNFNPEALFNHLRVPFKRYQLGQCIQYTEEALVNVFKTTVPILNSYVEDQPSRKALTYL